MSEKKSRIIDEVSFGASPHDPNGHVVRGVVRFSAGVFGAEMIFPNRGACADAVPPSSVTDRMVIDNLTNQFREELERAAGLRP